MRCVVDIKCGFQTTALSFILVSYVSSVHFKETFQAFQTIFLDCHFCSQFLHSYPLTTNLLKAFMSVPSVHRPLVRSYAVENIAPLGGPDHELKAAIISNEAIRRNLLHFKFDVYQHLDLSPIVFNLMIYETLKNINEINHLCSDEEIVKGMASSQWILSFLVHAATDDTVSTAAKKHWLS